MVTHLPSVELSKAADTTGAVIHRMPHPLQTKLVIANLAKSIAIILGKEVVGLINAGNAGQSEISAFQIPDCLVRTFLA